MDSRSLKARAIGSKKLPPKSAKLIHALRFIGYTFEQAISDLVDNSISAAAKRICVRLLTGKSDVSVVVIGDDGCGMTEERLEEAMTFGSESDYTDQSLGKYGLGLKLASISHARIVEVLTWQGTAIHGRRWTIEGLANGWECDVLDPAEVKEHVARLAPSLKDSPSGTVVVWHELDRLSMGRQGIRKGSEQLVRTLELHLGLHFHRFLESRRTSMTLQVDPLDRAFTPTSQEVRAVNPFGYPESGDPDYPKTYTVQISGRGNVRVRACIWPPNSKEREYRLGGKAAQRQGFYFYRRDRLIQAGGWNGVLQHESEAHSSLARLAIDLPAELDAYFGLSVQKSRVVTDQGFSSAVQDSKDESGAPWLAKYRKDAATAYRRDKRSIESYPFVPDDGIPARLAELAYDELANGRRRDVRRVRLEWGVIPGPDFFEIQRDQRVIRINKNYRRTLLRDRRGSPADLPLVKLLIFFLLEQDLDSDRVTSAQSERLNTLNRMLSAAVHFEARD